MDDLVQFLRDRLTDDEQTARAATWDEWDSAHWTAHRRAQYDGRWVIVDHAEEGVTELTPHAADDAGVAQHIARHDPARVLRDVEAQRQIMQVHNARDNWGTCVGCPRDAEGSMNVGIDECPILRALALPYADHPDYQDAWRP
ncbi:DUF6221 family protein [Streptomyces sp. NPDC058629]|uniref:DUF6221 family protein n=1 Tax=Streptomyces sp. NPDC058629 TaxID=3346565 RepID=UPI0036520DB2